MLDVIIYEDDEVSIKESIKVINMAFVNSDIDYKIYKFNNFNDEFLKIINNGNQKLLIINMETGNKGMEIASLIRKNSLNNIIILTAKCNKYYDQVFDHRLIAFDYICKCDDYQIRLKNDIDEIVKHIYKNDIFVFKYNHVMYRIPLDNINYIEKEANVKRCIIHTTDDDYYIVSSIDKLICMLKNNFIKTHQSCIVNTDNIKILDCVNNRIIFNDDSKTSLVTERAKKEIKERIFNNQC